MKEKEAYTIEDVIDEWDLIKEENPSAVKNLRTKWAVAKEKDINVQDASDPLIRKMSYHISKEIDCEIMEAILGEPIPSCEECGDKLIYNEAEFAEYKLCPRHATPVKIARKKIENANV